MEFSEKVIVLKIGVFREADCWVRFMSPSRGVMTGFAFGGKRSRRRFAGCLDPLSQVLFHARTGRKGDYLCLEEGTLCNRFAGLKKDLKKLGMVSNCLRFFEAVHAGTEGIGSAHDLLLETLLAVDGSEEISDFFPLLFRAKLTFSQGYAPNLSWCAGCGTPLAGRERIFFQVQDGTAHCRRCRPGSGWSVTLDPGASAFLTRLALAEPDDWVHWAPSGDIREGCSRFVDAFVQCHLDLVCEGNRFFRR
jgi:DNA repair protein RecO (recombination protein O)